MEDVHKEKRTNVDAFKLAKGPSTLDFTLNLSWLLDQSTIDFLLSNWGPVWVHVYMKSWLNQVSHLKEIYEILRKLKNTKTTNSSNILIIYLRSYYKNYKHTKSKSIKMQ